MGHQQAATAATEPTSRFFELNGLKLHYLDWGGDPDKHTFVLLHGGAAHVHWWDYMAPMLTAHGRVIALDFRGHGRSQWARPPHYGPPAYVEDVRGLLETLGTRVVLVGHSMGGAVAQWCALRLADRLEALVIIDAPHGPPPLWRRLQWRWRRRAHGGKRPELKSAEDITRKFRFSPPSSYLTAEQRAELALKGAEQLPNGNWAFRFDPETRAWRKMDRPLKKPNLRLFKVPTLVLRGAESELITPRLARRMHRRIANSQYRKIPRAFHHVPLDNPAGTAQAIIEFVEGLGRRDG